MPNPLLKIERQRRVDAMICDLCGEFALPVILAKVKDIFGSWYRYDLVYRFNRRVGRKVQIDRTQNNRISISLNGSRIDASVLHEFAHYLAHSRTDFRPDRTGHHGPAFQRALTDVATFWYGDPWQYPWKSEYRTLRAGPLQVEPTCFTPLPATRSAAVPAHAVARVQAGRAPAWPVRDPVPPRSAPVRAA